MSPQEFEAINLELIETQKALIERERILSVMASVDKQLMLERRHLSKRVLEKKYAKYEVQELERITPKSIFYKLLKSHNEQLDKQVEQYLKAKMAVENCLMRIMSLETYLQELEQELIELADVDDQYEVIQQSQILLLSQLNSPQSEKLEMISQELPKKMAMYREVQEAYKIGQLGLDGIDKTVEILTKGRGFGGQWTSGTIREAVETSLNVQPTLEKFQQELIDISQHFWNVPDIRTPRKPDFIISIFSVIILGSQITDNEEQAEIKKWLAYLQNLSRTIKKKVDMLEKETAILQIRIDELEKEKINLIEQLWEDSNFIDSTSATQRNG